MYTGIVCLVLFDARGTLTEPYWTAVAVLAALVTQTIAQARPGALLSRA